MDLDCTNSSQPPQPASTPAPGITDIASTLATLVKDGTYRFVVRGGKLVSVSEGDCNSEFITMKQIAEEFKVSYFSVSRNWWKKLRLHFYRMGKVKLFKRTEFYAAMERLRSKPSGRPKKTIGVIA